MIGSTRLSLRKAVVPRNVLTVWLVESRMGFISFWRRLINLASWIMRTTKANPRRRDSNAIKMIKTIGPQQLGGSGMGQYKASG